MALRFLLRRRSMVITTALLAALLLARQGFMVEPDSLLVREYPLDLPSWPVTLDGFRIAAVGDIHAGSPYCG